jgi:diaminohydroxyphosphoribosylaminopyrimidine deaminase/5-amino-6-(5-phosphoribosylamino)uracil reductase
MLDDQDASFLRRAIALAINGRGTVEPNPMVGCVITKAGRVIGEGFHARFGGPHAEPNALAACRESPAGATAYVTLEPCCHTNKKTPPCVPALIAAGIARVLVGCLDPNPHVSGRGLAMLREAGITVEGPILEAQCKQLIAPFIARTDLNRPYITLKWAQTADGKIAGPGGRRMQISNDRSTAAVHRLRTRCSAILVGINTVLNDDPILTARGIPETPPVLRCVLDRHLRMPIASNLVRTIAQNPVLIGCEETMLSTPSATLLKSLGVQLAACTSIAGFLEHLKVAHLLVEPGPTLARSFFADQLADRLWVFNCAKSANEPHALDAPEIPPNFRASGTIDFNGDLLTEYLNTTGDLFFAREPSTDLLLEMKQRS